MSPRTIELFQNPRNVGELPAPAITAEASNPVCGDVLRLSIRLEDGRVCEARYKARGCAASIAAGSALTELIEGKDADAMRRLTREDVDRAAGGLTNESKHAAVLCIDCVRALLAQL